MEDMVKVTLFLADIADLDAVNAVYRILPHSLPTRTVLAVASLPLGARVQMDALLSNGKAPSPGSLPAAQDLPQQRQGAAGSALQPERRLLPLQQYRCPAAGRPRLRRLVDGGIRSRLASACATSKPCWRASMCRLTISSR
jgi:hypothetical protein